MQSGLHLHPQQAQLQLSWEARALQTQKHSTWLPKEVTLLLAKLDTERFAGANPKPAAVMTQAYFVPVRKSILSQTVFEGIGKTAKSFSSALICI